MDEKIYLLNKLNPRNFAIDIANHEGTECKEYSVEAALFLTYSIDSKAVLATLLALFDIPSVENDKNLDMKMRWQKLMQFPNANGGNSENLKWQKDRVAYVCNDGYDKSIASSLYYYTEGFMSYYKVPENESYHSFHPKLYVVKYKEKGEETVYFRFIISSMNLVDSKNKELMCCFDLRAYKRESKQGDEDYAGIDIIQKLLDYHYEVNDEAKNYTTKYVENSNLQTVLKELGMEKYCFHKSEMPKLLTYPQLDRQYKAFVQNTREIYSPFLSKSFLSDIKDGPIIYTMESELLKNGYEKLNEGENTDDSVLFGVYTVEEEKEQPLYSHFKAYIMEDNSVYIGSANYTVSAFGKNKELLVKVEIEDSEMLKEFINNLKENYEPNYYKRITKAQNEDEQVSEVAKSDLFRNLVVMLGRILRIKYDGTKVSLNIISRESGQQDDQNIIENTVEQCFALWNKIQKIYNEPTDIKLCIAPFFYSEEQREIQFDGTSIRVKEGNWEGLKRRDISQHFRIVLKVNGKEMGAVKILLNCEDSDSSEKLSALKEEQDCERCVRLSKYMDMKSFRSSSLNKELSQLNIHPTQRSSEQYYRKCMPTIEEVLRICIENEQDITDGFRVYRGRLSDVLKLARILKERKLTKEEQSDYAYMDGKLIGNIQAQFERVCEELGISQREVT